MRTRRIGFAVLVIAAVAVLSPPLSARVADVHTAPVVSVELKGAIGPTAADYIARAITQAATQNAQLVVIKLDTPGGLDSAMREIVQTIIAAPMAVASYVAPSGARAASAGTYIMYASHIAAMAPGTNLGAATPVTLGAQPANDDAMAHKRLNDAIAYIRSLAGLRKRNADWAEQSVRQGASLHADAALKQNVVDLIAGDVNDLLQQLHGREVIVAEHKMVLDTAHATVVAITPDWRTRVLSVITDPNVAYILMLLGIYGLFFELWNPGFVLPGVIGGIALLLALFAFQVLPVSYAGVGLIVLGVAFMVAEAHVASFGALGIGGTIAFVAGSLLLFDTNLPGFGLSWGLIAILALISAAFFIGVATLTLRARGRPVVTGAEQLLGTVGVVKHDFIDQGLVRIRSEDWQARSTQPLSAGQRVRVRAIEGLTLVVEPDES